MYIRVLIWLIGGMLVAVCMAYLLAFVFGDRIVSNWCTENRVILEEVCAQDTADFASEAFGNRAIVCAEEYIATWEQWCRDSTNENFKKHALLFGVQPLELWHIYRRNEFYEIRRMWGLLP